MKHTVVLLSCCCALLSGGTRDQNLLAAIGGLTATQ